MLNYLQTFAASMRSNLPGFISLGIMDFSGNVLVKEQVDNRVNVDLEAAFQLEIVKQAMTSLSISELNVGNKIKDITLETDKFTYFISLSDDQKAVLVVMLDAQKVNIGLTRSFIAKGKKDTGAKLDKDL